MNLERLGPFDHVLDAGGNVGDFAEYAARTWPWASVDSFEPIPGAAKASLERANGRWNVHPIALSSSAGRATLRVCANQHSASTLQRPGTLRRDRFGIRDVFRNLEVDTRRLDEFRPLIADGGRTLLKVDVEGHELEVFRGALHVLGLVHVVVCEVNQEPTIFLDAPPPDVVDSELRSHGLYFAGVAGVGLDPKGEVVQFDGVWMR